MTSTSKRANIFARLDIGLFFAYCGVKIYLRMGLTNCGRRITIAYSMGEPRQEGDCDSYFLLFVFSFEKSLYGALSADHIN